MTNVLKEDFHMQFRDANERGVIDAKGYLNYFQNQTAKHMYNMRRGNDTLTQDFGVAWIFAKYRLQNCKMADFSGPIHAEVWLSNVGRVKLETDIEFSRDGEIFCSGRLESCLFDAKKHTLSPLKAAELPDGVQADRRADVDPFSRPSIGAEDMEYVYTYMVRYADLDNNRHMTNLSYAPMFLNAFGSDFYENRNIKNLEIHYINQAFEGEEMKILKSYKDGHAELYACKADGTKAAWCCMDMEDMA